MGVDFAFTVSVTNVTTAANRRARAKARLQGAPRDPVAAALAG